MATRILRKVTPKETEKPTALRERLAALIESLPAAHRPGFEKWREDFKGQLEIADYAAVDDICICLSAAEEIEQIAGALESLQEMAENTPEERFANILRPVVHWLNNIIGSDFPGTKLIRQHLVEEGLGEQIRG